MDVTDEVDILVVEDEVEDKADRVDGNHEAVAVVGADTVFGADTVVGAVNVGDAVTGGEAVTVGEAVAGII